MQDIEEIYKQYSKTIYKYLFCLTRDKSISEELTQETFAIAIKEISKFKGDCKVSTWLCQIAKHLWYKQLKKKNKYVFLEDVEEDLQEIESIEEIILNREDELQLYKDIHKLDEKSRELIYLRIIGNLNFIEIGEILGKTANWARVNFYRAKQKLMEVSENGKEN